MSADFILATSDGLNDSQQIARQMDRNLVTGLLAWIVEFRKFCNEDADVLPHLQQIDLCAEAHILCTKY